MIKASEARQNCSEWHSKVEEQSRKKREEQQRIFQERRGRALIDVYPRLMAKLEEKIQRASQSGVSGTELDYGEFGESVFYVVQDVLDVLQDAGYLADNYNSQCKLVVRWPELH